MAQAGAGAAAKPMRADARRNYEAILKEAAIAFAERGEQASLDDIAKRAGVGSGTLYRHFPTRQALLEGVYVDSIEEIAARADELGAGPDPGEALTLWLRELAEQMIRIRGLKALLGAAVTDGSSAVMSKCSEKLKAAADRLLSAAQDAGAVRRDLKRTELLRLTHALATAAELSQGGTEDVGRYLTLLLEGIRPPV
ncbi:MULTISPECIES: TetR/AcrR family transcriptional regulator [unclassified Streptomyces]|uniref:TetR/AcrR family transcriptional regulator n=1 Tax=unclassified Streptomyces TaxID=2593676 RepID=UPI00382A90F4